MFLRLTIARELMLGATTFAFEDMNPILRYKAENVVAASLLYIRLISCNIYHSDNSSLFIFGVILLDYDHIVELILDMER